MVKKETPSGQKKKKIARKSAVVDCLGNPLQEGDVITYPVRGGPELKVSVALIRKIGCDEFSVHLYVCTLVYYKSGPKAMSVTLPVPERTTKVHPEYYNEEIKNILLPLIQ